MNPICCQTQTSGKGKNYNLYLIVQFVHFRLVFNKRWITDALFHGIQLKKNKQKFLHSYHSRYERFIHFTPTHLSTSLFPSRVVHPGLFLQALDELIFYLRE